MSTYSDNLRATVVASLQSQELELIDIEAQQTAALFTLYHAQSAVMTDALKLEQGNEELSEKSALKLQAVKCNNTATNQLSSALQSNTYVMTSQTNSAVGAANVQTAANAIVRLASDMGSIYSMLQAADMGSAMFKNGSQARELINITAQLAEHASDVAMQASAQIAEVASSVVSDQSKAVNAAMVNILKVSTDDYAAAITAKQTDNDNLTSAKVTEKQAEGYYQNITTDELASQSAFDTMNRELNINLVAEVKFPDHQPHQPHLHISFDQIVDPFSDIINPSPPDPKDGAKYETNLTLPAVSDNHPVDAYYLFFVKNQEKYTFSIEKAENIISSNDPEEGSNFFYRLLTYPVSDVVLANNALLGKIGTGTDNLPNFTLNPIDLTPVPNLVNGGKYYDSDGDPISLGGEYVVFIMASFTNVYKRRLNDFSDFLSAPSELFCPTLQLPAATVTAFDGVPLKKGTPGFINFNCPGLTDKIFRNIYDINFRVMLLPYRFKGTVDGLLPTPSNHDVVNLAASLHVAGNMLIENGLHFTFNAILAAQVDLSNYIPVDGQLLLKQVTGKNDESAQGKDEDIKDTYVQPTYSAQIRPDTTDIFGNPLHFEAVQYLAVVLTISDVLPLRADSDSITPASFTNKLSSLKAGAENTFPASI